MPADDETAPGPEQPDRPVGSGSDAAKEALARARAAAGSAQAAARESGGPNRTRSRRPSSAARVSRSS